MRPIRFVAELVPPPQPPPPPPRPPVDELPWLPLNSEVEKRHATLGTIQRSTVIELLQRELEKQFLELADFAPAPAASIAAHRETAQTNWLLAVEKLRTARGLVGDLQSALSRRADVLKQAADNAATLATVKQQLADPSCLAMDAADLLRLQKQTEFLPGIVADLQRQADTLAETIRDLLKRGQVDGVKLLAFMRKAADKQPGQRNPADPDVWRRFQTGFMALP